VVLAFKLPGIVTKRPLSEGDPVRSGEVVARLDDTELGYETALRKAALDQLEAGSLPGEVARAAAVLRAAQAALDAAVKGSRAQEIAKAEAAVKAARAALVALESGSRPEEIAVAKASVRAAGAGVERWKAESRRASELSAKGVVTSRDAEAVQEAFEEAQARLTEAQERLNLAEQGPRKETIEQARAFLESARETLSLAREGPRKETIEQLRSAVDQAKASLGLVEAGPRKELIEQARASWNLARCRLEGAVLRSPLTGVVLTHAVEPGEYVAPGTPVLTVADLGTVWFRAYIGETDLGRVRVGMTVKIRNDTYPDRVYEGRITAVASEAEFTPKNVQTRGERVKLVYRIKVEVPNSGGDLKPGMPADGEIVVGEH